MGDYYGYDAAEFGRQKIQIMQNSQERISSDLRRLGETVNNTISSAKKDREEKEKKEKADAFKYRQALEARNALVKSIDLANEYNPEAARQMRQKTGRSSAVEVIPVPPKDMTDQELNAYLDKVNVQITTTMGMLSDNPQIPPEAISKAAGIDNLPDEARKALAESYRKTMAAKAGGDRTAAVERMAEQAVQPEMQSMGPAPARPGEAAAQPPSTAQSMGISTPTMEPKYAVPGTAAKTTSQLMGSSRFGESVGGQPVTPKDIEGTRTYQAMQGAEKESANQQKLALAVKRYNSGQTLTPEDTRLIDDRLDDNYRQYADDFDGLSRAADAAKNAKSEIPKLEKLIAEKNAALNTTGDGSPKEIRALQEKLDEMKKVVVSAPDPARVSRAKADMNDAKQQRDMFRKKNNMLPKSIVPVGTETGDDELNSLLFSP